MIDLVLKACSQHVSLPSVQLFFGLFIKKPKKWNKQKNCFRVGSYHHSHSFFFQRIFSCFFLSFWIILSLFSSSCFLSRSLVLHLPYAKCAQYVLFFFWNPTGRFAVRRVSNYSPLEKQNWYLWFILRRLDKDIIKAVPFN